MRAANIDFETYSEAGFDFTNNKWVSTAGKGKKGGLDAAGTVAYIQHPSFDILSLAYDLNDGLGPRLWIPGMEPPTDLFDFIQSGGLVKAWNSFFEYCVWNIYAFKHLGWPALPLAVLRDSMAKAGVYGLPFKLEKAAQVAEVKELKIADGKRLLTKFSRPRNPTKKDKRLRVRPQDDPQDAVNLYNYNIGDIKAEAAVDRVAPDLSPREHDLWVLDQKINIRGVQIDRDGLSNCQEIVRQATDRYVSELQELTNGWVNSPNELDKMKLWLHGQGVKATSLNAEAVEQLLKDIPANTPAHQVVKIRSILGASSVKKLKTIGNQLSNDGRLHGLFQYYGAPRTGRWAGRGPQPQNLTSKGPDVQRCECGHYYVDTLIKCPHCGMVPLPGSGAEWGIDAVQDALEVIAHRDLDYVERVFGDPIAAVAGCLRGLFVAAPDHDLICSDYSAIEAVVLAAVAGEEWRLDVFRTHGKIYEMSAAKISGVPFEEIIGHKEQTGQHHHLRKTLGKVAELASGYGGWVGAWKNFGADKHMSEPEIKKAILSWREASPAIVALWGGLENAAVSAIMQPGQCFQYRGISYGVKNDILHCMLPSGRVLYYHKPRIAPAPGYFGKTNWNITYMGWNSDSTKGPIGWVRLNTYGSKFCENVIQAIARDILAGAMLRVEAAGYPIVLHVHDEILAEIRKHFGSIQELERLMGILDPWCADWPIKAVGGWRGLRFRKD